MADDEAKNTAEGGSTDGTRRRRTRQATRASAAVPEATDRLAGTRFDDASSLDAALGLGIRVARARIVTCAALMTNAEAAFDAKQADLAIDAILDVEPLLHEAQTILAATAVLRRIVREDQAPGR
ncbi:hypothetical protein [Phreatobacter oligotrophus]|uniref:Uncharacterized protein n=1 Tax=Phreatobacter oligotrophus TaxID=1122261 RepID=A0A2T4YY53_9HYPH|nr:hypothetical protein [Phreatobacter oligotrophus]PTM51466.1 hypothetical protein C8P69_110132 [Phreatobacter oligotrophus]